MLNRVVKAGPVIIGSIFAALFCELFYESITFANQGTQATVGLSSISGGGVVRVVLAFAIFMTLSWLFFNNAGRLINKIFRFRYPIAVALLVLGVVFELSGSSVSSWSAVMGEESSPLLGISRGIRSDEWLVFTPFALSQSETGFHAISEVIRGTQTDVTMVYAAPSWSIASIFRPYLWGFLIFGSAKGLSFFWLARFISLFLVSFECARLFTSDKRSLSAAFAVLITFSPMVQWWFSTACCELLIFGQALVLALNAYLCSDSCKRKALFGALIGWLAFSYVFVLYPSWQVPLFYVFAMMGVWVVFRYRKQRTQRKNSSQKFYKRVPAMKNIAVSATLVIPILVFGIIAGVALYGSKDVISITMSTAYPGARLETGGGLGLPLWGYSASLLSSLDPSRMMPNVCEASSMFCLFPLGTVIGLVLLIRKKDMFSALLLIVQAVLLVYGVIGFPEWLAKLTLLSNVQVGRLPLAIGFVEVCLLFHALSLCSQSKDKRKINKRPILYSVGLAALSTIMITIFFWAGYHETISVTWLILAMFALSACCLAIANIVLFGKYHPSLFLVSLLVVAIPGLCVNPVQQGAGILKDSEAASSIAQITERDPSSLWLCDNSIYGQFCVAQGAPTINSVNAFPDNSRWESIDYGDSDLYIYNRYAKIDIALQEAETSFYLDVPDTYTVYLNVDDLKKLNVKYYLSDKDLQQFSDEETTFTAVDSFNGHTIYEVKYL